MKVYTEIQAPCFLDGSPAAAYGLTIGNFDGMHLGHQKIIKRVRELVGPTGIVGVLTFSNHTSTVLSGTVLSNAALSSTISSEKKPAKKILSDALKLHHLKTLGVDVVYFLEFTSEFAALSYDVFIRKVQISFPFSFLVLGDGATFGKGKEGTPQKTERLGQELDFSMEYLSKVRIKEEEISSEKIRKAILEGDLKKVTKLLGHPYALEGILEPTSSQNLNQKISLSAADDLCLPPNEEYLVLLKQKNREIVTTAWVSDKTLSGHFSLLESGKILIFFQ